MYKSKYSNFLTVLLIIIIIAVIGLLGYIGYNVYRNYTIRKAASEYVESFVGETDRDEENTKISGGNVVGNDGENKEENKVENVDVSKVDVDSGESGTQTTTPAKKKTQYKGFDSIGTIQIPAINVNYPVLSKTTKKSLETSVALLYPDNVDLNQEGNVVIVGHNYRNGTFFSNNKKLKIGDKINITDAYGKKITYIIYNIFEANQSDTSFYNRDTNGKREVTLSTCTDASNDMRLIVEAKEQ